MKNIIAAALLSISVVACQQPGASDAPSTQSVENADVNEMPIATPEDFKSATSKIGNAQGNSFSGQYIMNSTGIKYGADCKADFVKTTDFFINSALSEDEISKIIQNGGSPNSSGDFIIQQEDGKIIFVGAGDDSTDISGAINGDGSFEIVSGSFISKDLYKWHMWEGKIETGQANQSSKKLSATLRGFIKIDTPSASIKGSCNILEKWSGSLVPFIPTPGQSD